MFGHDVIDTLEIVKRLDAVSLNSDAEIKRQYHDLFTGLGCMDGDYTMRLKEDAKHFAVFTPRRVPVNLLPQLKDELDKLQQLGVIKRVNEPTPWCAPIVVVPKKSTGIRLCVDLTRLNDAILREQYMLPALDQMLLTYGRCKSIF